MKSVLLYGSETWRETVNSSKCSQTFVNKCLRNILNIRCQTPSQTKNCGELWGRTQQQPISQTIRTRKWRWVGHILRKKKTTQEHLAQRTTHRTKNNRKDLERGKKNNNKRQKEVERNCSRPMSLFWTKWNKSSKSRKYIGEI